MAHPLPEVAVEAELAVAEPLEVLPAVVVALADLALLSLLEVLAHPPRAQRAVVAQRAVLAVAVVLALLEVEAELAVEEPRCRSFSVAMAGNLTSAATPRYSLAPRSGRKAKPRP